MWGDPRGRYIHWGPLGDNFYLDDHLPRKQPVVIAVVVVVVVVQPGSERWNSTRLMSRQKACVKVNLTLTKVRVLKPITRFKHFVISNALVFQPFRKTLCEWHHQTCWYMIPYIPRKKLCVCTQIYNSSCMKRSLKHVELAKTYCGEGEQHVPFDANPQMPHSAPKLNGSCMSHWHCRSWCSASGGDRRAPVPVPRNQSGHAAILTVVQLRYDGMTRESLGKHLSCGGSMGPCMIKWDFCSAHKKYILSWYQAGQIPSKTPWTHDRAAESVAALHYRLGISRSHADEYEHESNWIAWTIFTAHLEDSGSLWFSKV